MTDQPTLLKCEPEPNPHNLRALPRSYAITNKLPSRTKQEFADDADINSIVSRYRQTGYLPPANTEAFYADFETAHDYIDARERILDAEDAFAELPSAIRSRFENRPELFLAFVDHASEAELLEAGIVSKTPTDAAGSPTASSNAALPAAPAAAPPAAGGALTTPQPVPQADGTPNAE